MAAKQSKPEALFSRYLSAVGLRPRREYRFHPERKWRFDFAWPGLKLAVEIEGGVYMRGRHLTPKGFIADCEKYNTATLMGWRVLRIPVAGKEWLGDATIMVQTLVEELRG